jgi:hypothetical protein
MTPTENFISRLEGLQPRGHGKWMARCPAHEDRSASLAITETGDTFLIKCFAECSAAQIMASLGLELSDFYPKKTDQHFVRGQKRPFSAQQILQGIAVELRVVSIITDDLARGKVLPKQDQERFLVARQRIFTAIEGQRL